MIDNIERIGNFTSSNVFRLCASTVKGEVTAAFYTYVQEKMFERSLGRSLEMGAYSQAMAWGNFLEKRVNDNLGNAYIMVHKQTNVHPVHKFWTGSPDFDCPTLRKIAELKCFEPKNFASYVTALLTEDLSVIKKEHPKEYWQIVSNACIKGYSKGEAIVYMPYAHEMEQIRELAQDPEYLSELGVSPEDSWKFRFIVEKSNSQLAVLPDNSKFLNLNKFEFEIPEEDKLFLTKRVIDANKLITG
jgi:hypothetical protein